ncbi:MAG: RidA family protein [Chania sp.]
MMSIKDRLLQLNIELPQPWTLPPGIKIPAVFVRVHNQRVLVSGHVPIDQQGQIIGPFGKVGDAISLEEAQTAAHLTMLSIFASLQRELGNLDRIAAWVRVSGMVNSSQNFVDFPKVINPASQLIEDIFGTEIGSHSRIAIGVAGLPWNVPVEIEAELELL